MSGVGDLRVAAEEAIADDAGQSSGTVVPISEPTVAADRGVDGAPDAPPTSEAGPPDAATSTVKRVFASSVTYTADMGGLAGADARCNELAQAAGLGGTFVAWLSTTLVAARDRVTSDGPWSLVGESDVAVTKVELTSPPLTKPIRRDETGAFVSGRVWTGTGAGGGLLAGDCRGWTEDRGTDDTAVGDTGSNGPSWTAARPTECVGNRRLYCFQL